MALGDGTRSAGFLPKKAHNEEVLLGGGCHTTMHVLSL